MPCCSLHSCTTSRTSCGFVFFFKQKTAYEMRISDWSSDVCSSDLPLGARTWKWTLPSPRWPKEEAVVPGKALSAAAAASTMKAGMRATGTLTSYCSAGPCARSDSDSDSRMRQKARSEERRVGEEGVSTC